MLEDVSRMDKSGYVWMATDRDIVGKDRPMITLVLLYSYYKKSSKLKTAD